MMGDSRRFWFAMVVAVALLAWAGAAVWPFMIDDAFITLIYSDQLLAGHGLTWTSGERVEGFTSLGWVLLHGLLGLTGIPTTTTARGVSMAASLVALGLLAARFRGSAGVVVVPLLAAATAFGPWTIGGMEVTLLLLCLLGALLAAECHLGNGGDRPLVVAGAWLGFAASLRPEAPMAAIVTAVVVALAPGSPPPGLGVRVRRVVLVLAPTALVVAGWTAFRLVYYGQWLGNAAQVKLGDGSGPATWGHGLAYLRDALMDHRALLVAAALAALLTLRAGSRAFGLLVLGMAGSWCAFLIVVGGDFFPASRLFVPALAPAAVLVGLAAERLAAGGARAARLVWIGGLLLVVLARFEAVHSPQTARAAAQTWEQDALAVGDTLAAFAGRSPLLAVDAAGALPWACRLPVLDMFGLCDTAIAHEPERRAAPDPFSRAHWRGSVEHVLGRRPDLILFCRTPHEIVPPDARGRALVDDPGFVRDYRCIWLNVDDRHGSAVSTTPFQVPLWARLEGRGGIERRDDGITVPAWLCGSLQMVPGFRPEPPVEPEARLRWQAQLAQVSPWLSRRAVAVVVGQESWLEVRQTGDYRLTGLSLPADARRVEVDPPAPGATALVGPEDDGATLVLRVTQAPIRVRSLRLTTGR